MASFKQRYLIAVKFFTDSTEQHARELSNLHAYIVYLERFIEEIKRTSRIPPTPEQQITLLELLGREFQGECICGCGFNAAQLVNGLWEPVPEAAWHHIDCDSHNNRLSNFALLRKWCHIDHHARKNPIQFLAEWQALVLEVETGQKDLFKTDRTIHQ